MVSVEEEKGSDFEGTTFSSIEEMWNREVKEKEKWYGHSLSYWKQQDATVDGMLGGLGALAEADISSSLAFIRSLREKYGLGQGKALDCGAGIGRVSQDLLLKVFDRVDLVEPNESFLEIAKANLPENRVDNLFPMGLQEFNPKDGSLYDCVWIQWVIIYLTDEDFVSFLKRIKASLSPKTGLICIKDNVTRPGTGFALDRQDSSVTRSEEMLKTIFTRAGLQVIERKEQNDFPRELFPVVTFALKSIQ